MERLGFEGGGFRNHKARTPRKKREYPILDPSCGLPEEIIQRIQSFLNGKEAARSTILSKSWLAAWLTRPNLDLDKAAFGFGPSFLNFVNKTLQRYEHLNLTIDTLRLVMYIAPTHHVPVTDAKQVIAKTMELAVFDLDVNLWNPYPGFPVVLRSETLGRLSLHGNVTFDLGDLTFPKLKSICVTEAHVTGDLIGGFISRHPLIERVKFDSDRWGMLLPGGERIRVSCSFNDRMRENNDEEFEAHKLEYMCIGHWIVEGNIFLPRFRFLKELVITNCIAKTGDCRDIRIHSTSLERISIESLDEQERWSAEPDVFWNAEFDVPNIRKFGYKGGCARSGIALKGGSREWESNIHVRCPARNADAEWFIWLNQLLQKFSRSKLSLYIDLRDSHKHCEVKNMNMKNMGGTVLIPVECVTVDDRYEARPGFIDGLLRICRPKVMSIKCLRRGWNGEESPEVVRKRLNEEESLDAFEEGVWQPVPPKPFPSSYGSVCFQLKWRTPDLSS